MNADLGLADLKTSLERAVLRACEGLAEAIGGAEGAHAELRRRFLPAIDGINRIVIAPLSPDIGAFLVCGDSLTLNFHIVERILQTILSDVRVMAAAGRVLSPGEVFDLYERALVTFTLHELRHRTQGVEDLAVVRELKSIAGEHLMAELDVLADCDAGKIYALLYADGRSRGSYLESLKECLHLSAQYFMKAFPIAADRSDKIERSISVLLMAARLGMITDLSAYVENPELPLDAPIMAKLASNGGQLVILRKEPSLSVLAIANDHEMIGSLVTEICAGDMEAAYGRAAILVKAHFLV